MFDQELIISCKTSGDAAAGAQINRMKGDDYTIMDTNLPHIIMPAEKDVGFTTDGLVNIYFFHFTPSAIVVKDDSPFKTIQDLIECAKKNPGWVTMSGTGKGTTAHLVSVMFDKLVGVMTTYVPFAGTAPAATALLGSQLMASGDILPSSPSIPAPACSRSPWKSAISASPMSRPSRKLGINLPDGTYRAIAVPKLPP